MSKGDNRTIAIYSRKSKFTGKGESIENQIELCRQYISSRYSREAAAAAIVYEDEGFSGGNTDRPRLKSAEKNEQHGVSHQHARETGRCHPLQNFLHQQILNEKGPHASAAPAGKRKHRVVRPAS